VEYEQGSEEDATWVSDIGVSALAVTEASATGDAGWEEVTDEEGNSYFLNSTTGESQWDRPSSRAAVEAEAAAQVLFDSQVAGDTFNETTSWEQPAAIEADDTYTDEMPDLSMIQTQPEDDYNDTGGGYGDDDDDDDDWGFGDSVQADPFEKFDGPLEVKLCLAFMIEEIELGNVAKANKEKKKLARRKARRRDHEKLREQMKIMGKGVDSMQMHPDQYYAIKRREQHALVKQQRGNAKSKRVRQFDQKNDMARRLEIQRRILTGHNTALKFTDNDVKDVENKEKKKALLARMELRTVGADRLEKRRERALVRDKQASIHSLLMKVVMDEMTDGEPLKGFALKQQRDDDLMTGSKSDGLSRQELMLANKMRHDRKNRVNDEDVGFEKVYKAALLHHRIKNPYPEIIPPEYEQMIKPESKKKKKKKFSLFKKKATEEKEEQAEEEAEGGAVPDKQGKNKGSEDTGETSTRRLKRKVKWHGGKKEYVGDRRRESVLQMMDSANPWFAVVPKPLLIQMMQTNGKIQGLIKSVAALHALLKPPGPRIGAKNHYLEQYMNLETIFPEGITFPEWVHFGHICGKVSKQAADVEQFMKESGRGSEQDAKATWEKKQAEKRQKKMNKVYRKTGKFLDHIQAQRELFEREKASLQIQKDLRKKWRNARAKLFAIKAFKDVLKVAAEKQESLRWWAQKHTHILISINPPRRPGGNPPIYCCVSRHRRFLQLTKRRQVKEMLWRRYWEEELRNQLECGEEYIREQVRNDILRPHLANMEESTNREIAGVLQQIIDTICTREENAVVMGVITNMVDIVEKVDVTEVAQCLGEMVDAVARDEEEAAALLKREEEQFLSMSPGERYLLALLELAQEEEQSKRVGLLAEGLFSGSSSNEAGDEQEQPKEAAEADRKAEAEREKASILDKQRALAAELEEIEQERVDLAALSPLERLAVLRERAQASQQSQDIDEATQSGAEQVKERISAIKHAAALAAAFASDASDAVLAMVEETDSLVKAAAKERLTDLKTRRSSLMQRYLASKLELEELAAFEPVERAAALQMKAPEEVRARGEMQAAMSVQQQRQYETMEPSEQLSVVHEFLQHEHDLDERMRIMEDIAGLERADRLTKVKQLAEGMPLLKLRRFRVVRKEIQDREAMRAELQGLSPVERLVKLKRKADEVPSLKRFRATRQRRAYLNEERDREEAVAACLKDMLEQVEAVFTLTDSEIEMRVMTVIREMTLSVQLHVLRAEQVVYADEVEGKMDEAIWKRKIVFRKELCRQEEERKMMFDEEEAGRVSVERRIQFLERPHKLLQEIGHRDYLALVNKCLCPSGLLLRMQWERTLQGSNQQMTVQVKDPADGRRYIMQTYACLNPADADYMEEQATKLMEFSNPFICNIREVFRFTHQAFNSYGVKTDKFQQMAVLSDYCPGGTLIKKLHDYNKMGALQEAELIKWMVQITAGISAMHSRGLVHRNIK
jgi:hypothetical protein